MIQGYLSEQLKSILFDLEWTADYYTGEDHTGTVYSEGGSGSDTYESEVRYLSYMVYIRSSKWSFAESVSQKVYKELHRKGNFVSTVNEYDNEGNVISSKSYYVFFMSAAGEPNRIGVENDIMVYSINFDVILREMKEDEE